MKISFKVIVFILVALSIGIVVNGCAKKASSNLHEENIEEGKLAITVVDNTSKKPISDAKIVILGLDGSYKTDEKGKTPEITLNINKDIYKRYGDKLYKMVPAGSATVLVFKEGYKDYIAFNNSIFPGITSNTMNIGITKSSKSDKENYSIEMKYPHMVWMQELISYCKNIKEEKAGSGTDKLTINIKDQNSRAIEGAYIAIPETGIKIKTDKSGNAVIMPSLPKPVTAIYPIERNITEYTVVATKDGYQSCVIFNVTLGEKNSKILNVVMKNSKNTGNEDCATSFQPFEKEWIEKIISNYKN